MLLCCFASRRFILYWMGFGSIWMPCWALSQDKKSFVELGASTGAAKVFFVEYDSNSQPINDEEGYLTLASAYGTWQSAADYFVTLSFSTSDGELDYTGFNTALTQLEYSQTQSYREDVQVHLGKRIGIARFYLGLGQLSHQRDIEGRGNTVGVYEQLESSYWLFGSQLHFNAQGHWQLKVKGALGSDFLSEVETSSANYNPILLNTGKHLSVSVGAELFYAFKYGFSAGLVASYDQRSIKRGNAKELKLNTDSTTITTSIAIPKTKHEIYSVYPFITWQWAY
jgi:hypothetical protein